MWRVVSNVHQNRPNVQCTKHAENVRTVIIKLKTGQMSILNHIREQLTRLFYQIQYDFNISTDRAKTAREWRSNEEFASTWIEWIVKSAWIIFSFLVVVASVLHLLHYGLKAYNITCKVQRMSATYSDSVDPIRGSSIFTGIIHDPIRSTKCILRYSFTMKYED